MAETWYRLTPGLEIVNISESQFALRSDFAAIELSGDTAKELIENVLTQLRQPLTFNEIAQRMPGYKAESLYKQIDSMVCQGILECSTRESPVDTSIFSTLLKQMGLASDQIMTRLANSKVAIFGLEAHGAHVASMLADVGVGNLLLVDPFPFSNAHFALTPVTDPAAVGRSREMAVSHLLSRSGIQIETGGEEPLNSDRVCKLVAGCQLLISCWDRGFTAHHWVNNASREHGIPALFSELKGTSSFAGPFYYPERSACWMCYRMRVLSCEKDFSHAMAYEEHLDRKREPSLAERPVLPILPIHLASTLGIEAMKYLARLNQPILVDHILEFDAMTSESRLHSVLVKPDCPTCSKKKLRVNPLRSEIYSSQKVLSYLPELIERLVSPRTGIITSLVSAPRDSSEPSRPLVRRARLSNHRFLSEQDETHAGCSGKGMNPSEALISCLGEAVERYSGGFWLPDELIIAQRGDLEGKSLDPNDLVLYLPEQYTELKYAPYREESKIAWVQARSLISDELVWVPAIAVFMEYQLHDEGEFLFPITSNGLAAGPTLCDAVLSAVYEVIERDALLISWLNKLPGRFYEAADHPDRDVRWMALAYRRRGVRLDLIELPTDHPVSVFMGIAFQEDGVGGPYATVGLGANLDPLKASRQAAIEVGQVRPTIRRRIRSVDAKRMAELGKNPADVRSLEDHALLYANHSTTGAFDFLFGEMAEWQSGTSWSSPSALKHLLSHFELKGQEVLYVNLTSPELESLGLFTARAILPGFQPVWFGRQERRIGGRRLYELPRTLGFTIEATSPESLNPLPHPLA